jgi:hypothetical protein
MDPEPNPAESDDATPDRATSRFSISLEDLERSTHVAVVDQVIEVPSVKPGRVPGDDDFTRDQRAVSNPGL